MIAETAWTLRQLLSCSGVNWRYAQFSTVDHRLLESWRSKHLVQIAGAMRQVERDIW
jgi:hypothetical protein